MDLPVPPVAWPPHTSPANAEEDERPAPAYARADTEADETRLRDERYEESAFGQEPFRDETYAQEPFGHDSFVQEPFAQEPFAQEPFAPEPFEASSYGSLAATPNERSGLGRTDRTTLTERAKTSPSLKDLWRRVAKEPETSEASGRPAMPKAANLPEPPLVVPLPRAGLGTEAMPSFAPHEAETEAGGAKEDWLENAFAELDSAIAQTPFSRSSETAAEPAPHESLEEEDAPPPLVAEPDEAEVSASAEEPAVIGRYEAEGTSYIMYADGSIEAQSERGVARFASMAELRNYFETQETPQ
jgi:hypothetical protein